MSFVRANDGAEAAVPTEWIADATRRLAGLADSDSDAGPTDPRWGDDAIDRLRAAVALQVVGLPRRTRPLATADPDVTITPLALSRAITAALSDHAAAESAAIADVEIAADGAVLNAVHVHLVAVGTDERERTFLDAGDRLRLRAVQELERIVGVLDVRLDVTWEDLLTEGPV